MASRQCNGQRLLASATMTHTGTDPYDADIQPDLVEAYLTHFRIKSDSLFWAWEAVDAATNSLEPGLSLCLALIEAAETPAELAYIAAGPLEDMLKRVGIPAAQALELPARQSAKVREALQQAWLSPEDAAFKLWREMAQ
jgi:hypothetical protein